MELDYIIDKMQIGGNSDGNTINLVIKGLLIVAVIVLFLIASYLLFIKLPNLWKKENMDNISNTIVSEQSASMDTTASQSIVMSENLAQAMNLINEHVSIQTEEQNREVETKEGKMEETKPDERITTKNTYNKFDEIDLPSSVDLPNGYIGRDYICFRNKIGDQNFVNKRSGCMACQVDSRQNGNKNYQGTNTNVIATCVYSNHTDPNDPDLWTKKMCIDFCSKQKYNDLKD